ncbi:MAG: phosphoenolpyruvate carboxykinase (GTP) [Clostridia bacterium]|nr:phosphoenolpyruvate carboxykinase (GTP) [Clostridia bacterium]
MNVHVKHAKANEWINQMIELANPAKVILIDGSETQREMLIKEAVTAGELHELNQEILPGCYLRRSDPSDVARVENRTFICTEEKSEAGPTNNWAYAPEMYDKLHQLFAGSMTGKTMYIIPYMMGPYGSPFSKIGFELTDSRYVVLSMLIMARCGQKVLDELGEEGEFVKGLHSVGTLNPEERYICHFPEDKAIYSFNSEYGGNVLQGKKCFSLRIASVIARDEMWLAEHMLILAIKKPDGQKTYVAAAFPSACGKTNLAMLVPPKKFLDEGYEVTTLGDDIAWLRKAPDGRLYAINPEFGFFGVAPGTSAKSNFNALESTKKGTIFTNVALNTDDNTVWWESLTKIPPENALDWKGNPWTDKENVKGAHPNSRFTAPAENCPCLDEDFNSPTGVPISAIIFGGRRAKLMPLVIESFDWNHGVFLGSSMGSETTAATTGKVGVTRRDPMAMLPFCGYNISDYFSHWIDMGEFLGDKAPKIYNVNWFRTDDDGSFMWPGFGENFRVLKWILARTEGEASGVECEIGIIPEEIDFDGLDITPEVKAELFEVNRELWEAEIEEIESFYGKLDYVPEALAKEFEALKKRVRG